jgi:hypothetical protein
VSADHLPLPAASADTLVYEVECTLDPDVAPAFDAWLPGHVAQVLETPGFLDAELLHPADAAPDGRPRRLIRYRVRDRAALDRYLEERAPALRADGTSRFGARVDYARRVQASALALAAAGAAAPRCANCAAPLTGPYCAACGQHAHESARSLHALFHDAWHSVTHVDGRFWQTLRLLAFRPGHLTGEYMAEHRARYVPPFRLYLVISVLFFGLFSVQSFGTHEEAGLSAEARQEKVAEALADAAEEASDPDRKSAESAPPAAKPPGPAAAAAEAPAAGAAPGPRKIAADGRIYDAAACAKMQVEPAWLRPAVMKLCARGASIDGGREIMHALWANVPKMMWVFLPLMAAVMVLLYWRPRRYYVEHLVFFLHVHAAIFLGLSAVMLLGVLGRIVPGLGIASSVAAFAMTFWVPWYIWRAMRVHYGNGRLLTFAKYATIFVLYVTFLMTTLLGTAAVTALAAG